MIEPPGISGGGEGADGMKRKPTFPRLRIDPIAAAVSIGLLITDHTGLCAALLIAAGVHEAGHLIAARMLGVALSELRLGLLGARIGTRGGLLPYRTEWLLAAAGPFASVVLAALVAPLRQGTELAMQICAVSLLLGALNLLPVETFDGGRMAYCALAGWFGAVTAAKVCRFLSFGVLFLLWSVSVYLLLRAGSGISWLGFSMSLFGRFFGGADGSGNRTFSENFGEKTRKTEQNRGKTGKL